MSLLNVTWPSIVFTAATIADAGTAPDISPVVTQCTASTPTSEQWAASSMADSNSSSSLDSLLYELSSISTYEQKWQEYLGRISTSGEISKKQALTAGMLWRNITSLFGLNAPLAITQSTVDSALQMAWNSQHEYLDIEILSDCRVTWFYRNRMSSMTDSSGEEPILFGNISPRFFRYFKRFIQAA